MDDVFSLPALPGYVDVKEAAEMLDVHESSVYRYARSGRLEAFHVGRNVLITEESIKQFKPNITGRPRKRSAPWHISPDISAFLVTYIHLNVYDGKQEELKAILSRIRQQETHLFPGTVVRYISLDNMTSTSVTIQLVWKRSDMPGEGTRQKLLESFRQELADVLDWSTAQYEEGTVLLHT